jgi:hypothetical protein
MNMDPAPSGRAPATRGRLGREGEMGRPRGRGPAGRQERSVGKKTSGPRLGRKVGWAESDRKFFSK